MVPKDAYETQKAARSFRVFAEQAWPSVEAKPFDGSGYHVDAICDHLQAVSRKQIDRLIVNIPPGYGKSTFCSVLWPAWVWTWDPSIKFWTGSYSTTLATRDSWKSRELIRSDWYQARWGDVFAMAGQDRKNFYANDKTGHRFATGSHGGTGFRGDIVLIDDPQELGGVYNSSVREATKSWWRNVASNRLNDPTKGAFIVVMQRAHADDLVPTLLEEGYWEHLVLPAECNPNKRCKTTMWTDPRSAGEPLWEGSYPKSEIARARKRLGSIASAAQLDQDPIDIQGIFFKTDWWQYWSEYDLKDFDMIVHSWDTGLKDPKRGHTAYTVGGVWGVKGEDLYLLCVDRRQLNFNETIGAIKDFYSEWPAHAILVESQAIGPAAVTVLENETKGLPLVLIQPRGGKQARAMASVPTIENGHVWLPAMGSTPWIDDYVRELARFPGDQYKDQVDMTTQFIIWWVENYTAVQKPSWSSGGLDPGQISGR